MRCKLFLLLFIVFLVGCAVETPGVVEDTPDVIEETPDVVEETPEEEQVFCTLDAKECPDGSYVSRVAPDCEFEACPEVEEVKMGTQVKLETSMGDIIIELEDDMPITTGNFEKLVKEGFYDGTIFHRIISGFMIQGGDPKGDGTGGPGYNIKDEFTEPNKNNRGTISMANAGPNTGGSQFFINLVNNNFLDDKHPVFGQVVRGMSVIDEMAAVKTGSGDRPVKEVKIIKAEII